MDREKVIKELHDARRYLEDKEWSDRGASPHIDSINDALALLKEQEATEYKPDKYKPDQRCWRFGAYKESLTPFDVLEIISSSYGGKQIFFQEKNGMIYDRYKGEYITLEDAVYKMAKMVGDDSDA